MTAMRILSAKTYGVKLKATIQATGKLGFTKGTSDALNLSANRFIKFAQDDKNDNDLYLVVTKFEDEDVFKLQYTSGYYSLGTKGLFDALNFDYKSNTIIFDLQRMVHLDNEIGGEVYKMNMRIIDKSEKNMES